MRSGGGSSKKVRKKETIVPNLTVCFVISLYCYIPSLISADPFQVGLSVYYSVRMEREMEILAISKPRINLILL